MNFDSQNELLSAYLDGELTPAEQARVEHLLAADPAARQLLDELRALSGTLKSLPRQKLGKDFCESVLQTVEKRKILGTDKSASVAQESGPVFSEPLPKTILRRLSNPRVLVWETLIVAVAVLLMVYNPNQNVPPGDQAQRQIAMGPKLEEQLKEVNESPSFRAVRDGVSADRTEESARLKDHAAKMDGSRRAGAALTDSEPEIMGKSMSSLADKQPDLGLSSPAASPVDKLTEQPTTLGFERKEKVLTRKQITAGEKPALDATDSKKDGLAITDEASLGDKSQTVGAKSALPPMPEQSLEHKKTDTVVADQLLVVRCEITPEAVKDRAFDKLLADNGIVWSEAPAQNQPTDKRRNIFEQEPTVELKSNIPADKPEGLAAWKDAPVNADPNKSGTLEVIYVEAPASQVESTLKGLVEQKMRFLSVSITPEKDGRQLEKFAEAGGQRHGIAHDFHETNGNAGSFKYEDKNDKAGAETNKNLTQRERQHSRKPVFSRTDQTALGLAQHLPPYSWFDVEKDTFQAEGQERHGGFAIRTPQSGISESGAMSSGKSGSQTYGGIAAGSGGAAPPTSTEAAGNLKAEQEPSRLKKGRAVQTPSTLGTQLSDQSGLAQIEKRGETAQKIQQSQDADSQSVFFGRQSKSSAPQQQMQRVLFVLQLSNRQGITDEAKTTEPAGAAAAVPAGTDANHTNAAPAEAESDKK
jgi:hypothetical protein